MCCADTSLLCGIMVVIRGIYGLSIAVRVRRLPHPTGGPCDVHGDFLCGSLTKWDRVAAQAVQIADRKHLPHRVLPLLNRPGNEKQRRMLTLKPTAIKCMTLLASS